MISMDTYFNGTRRIEDVRVQDCTRKDNIPFTKLSFPDIWGWIDFKIGDTAIISEENYDYIIMLWIFIMQEFCSSELLSKEFTIGFPDSSQSVEFIPISSEKVKVSFYDGRDDRSAIADKKELIKEVSREGIAFFTKIKELLPGQADSCEGRIMEFEILHSEIMES